MKNNNRNILICVVLMTLTSQAGAVLYTPAFPLIAHSLGICSGLMKSTFFAYLFGFGGSQPIYGLLSDKMGRKRLLLIGMLILALGALLCATSQSYTQFFVTRVIQGIGGGACITLSRAILRDSFSGKDLVRSASYLSSGFAIGMGATPVLGGWIAGHLAWQYEFLAITAISLISFTCFSLLLPETKTCNYTQPTSDQPVLQRIIRNPTFIRYLLAGTAAYCVSIAFNTMGPFLFQQKFGLSPAQYGFITLIIAAAYFLGTVVNRQLVHHKTGAEIGTIGIRLIILSSIILLVLSKLPSISLWVILLPLSLAILAQAMVCSICIAGSLNDFPDQAGIAAALFSCLQILLSAGGSVLVAIIPEHNTMPLALVILTLGLLARISIQRKKSGQDTLTQKRLGNS